jgi:hypothetical protein
MAKCLVRHSARISLRPPIRTFRSGPQACTAPGNPFYTPANWNLKDVNTTSGNTSQVNLQGAIIVRKNYHLGKHNSTLEFGFKERNAHKGQNAYSPTYDNPQEIADGLQPGVPPGSSTTFLAECQMSSTSAASPIPNYYFNDYRLGPVDHVRQRYGQPE